MGSNWSNLSMIGQPGTCQRLGKLFDRGLCLVRALVYERSEPASTDLTRWMSTAPFTSELLSQLQGLLMGWPSQRWHMHQRALLKRLLQLRQSASFVCSFTRPACRSLSLMLYSNIHGWNGDLCLSSSTYNHTQTHLAKKTNKTQGEILRARLVAT